jgi:hypothetical protein
MKSTIFGGRDTMQSGRGQGMFWKTILPQSSESKNKSGKKQAASQNMGGIISINAVIQRGHKSCSHSVVS